MCQHIVQNANATCIHSSYSSILNKQFSCEKCFEAHKVLKNASIAKQRSVLFGSRTYCDDVMLHLKDTLNKCSITLNKAA